MEPYIDYYIDTIPPNDLPKFVAIFEKIIEHLTINENFPVKGQIEQELLTVILNNIDLFTARLAIARQRFEQQTLQNYQKVNNMSTDEILSQLAMSL